MKILDSRKVYQKRKSDYLKEYRKIRHKIYYNRPEVKAMSLERARARRARKKAVSGTYTHEQIQNKLKLQKHKCYYCQARLKKVKGKYQYHIEHTFPLSRVAGTDIPANSIDYLVLSCPTCNLSKGNKFPWEWAQGGRLL